MKVKTSRMSAHDLQTIQNTFTKCLKDSAVFRRPDSHGNYFEVNNLRKDNKDWLVVAAGIDESEAGDLFQGISKRAEKAVAPLRFGNSCEISILFVARPFSGEIVPNSKSFPFAVQQGIPWIELREAYIRVWDLPDGNPQKLSNIRWEWDLSGRSDDPYEDWLREWKEEIGFNPSHSPSHLHFNTDRNTQENTSSVRSGDRLDDLRLAVGKPNPLALILSLAVWLRSL